MYGISDWTVKLPILASVMDLHSRSRFRILLMTTYYLGIVLAS